MGSPTIINRSKHSSLIGIESGAGTNGEDTQGLYVGQLSSDCGL
jgi:hypothetical protein